MRVGPLACRRMRAPPTPEPCFENHDWSYGGNSALLTPTALTAPVAAPSRNEDTGPSASSEARPRKRRSAIDPSLYSAKRMQLLRAPLATVGHTPLKKPARKPSRRGISWSACRNPLWEHRRLIGRCSTWYHRPFMPYGRIVDSPVSSRRATLFFRSISPGFIALIGETEQTRASSDGVNNAAPFHTHSSLLEVHRQTIRDLAAPVYSRISRGVGVLRHPDLNVLEGSQARSRLSRARCRACHQRVHDVDLALPFLKPAGYSLVRSESYSGPFSDAHSKHTAANQDTGAIARTRASKSE